MSEIKHLHYDLESVGTLREHMYEILGASQAEECIAWSMCVRDFAQTHESETGEVVFREDMTMGPDGTVPRPDLVQEFTAVWFDLKESYRTIAREQWNEYQCPTIEGE